MEDRRRHYERLALHRISLANECPDCGAAAGTACKPDYGCEVLDRAQAHLAGTDYLWINTYVPVAVTDAT